MYSIYETYDEATADLARIDLALGYPDVHMNKTYSQIGKDKHGRFYLPILDFARELFNGCNIVENIEIYVTEFLITEETE